MKSGIGKLRIRLDTSTNQHGTTAGSACRVLQECGLSDSGYAPEHEGPGPASPDGSNEIVKATSFGFPANERLRPCHAGVRKLHG
jgi:hypothetical protein